MLAYTRMMAMEIELNPSERYLGSKITGLGDGLDMMISMEVSYCTLSIISAVLLVEVIERM